MKLKDALLWPLALPYGAAVRLRAEAYRKGIFREQRLDGVVISVGNLTTGGTGKTPMVLWIAERLMAEGEKPGILTRGYRGQTSPEGTTSDEVQMLKARLGDSAAFGVGADRLACGRELAGRGIRWFLLDDGFQHLQIARDVDIVLIDATHPFGGGHLLPAGRLREPRRALERADIIVITRSRNAPAVEAAIQRDSSAPVFYARPRLDSVRSLRGGYPGNDDFEARERKFYAFCGIGNPSAFLADLRGWGFQVVGHKFFPDHHRYTQQDVREIQVQARQAGAEGALCTEKDVFNLPGAPSDECGAWYCRISLEVGRQDEFWQAIMTATETRA
ncbi:MAG: tetraacyldisaccharide 4'-kinase [Candidatus Acidiferrales bacterium]